MNQHRFDNLPYDHMDLDGSTTQFFNLFCNDGANIANLWQYPSVQSSFPSIPPCPLNQFSHDGFRMNGSIPLSATNIPLPPVSPYSHIPVTRHQTRSLDFNRVGPCLSRSVSQSLFLPQSSLLPPKPYGRPPRNGHHKRPKSDVTSGLDMLIAQNSPKLITAKPIEMVVGNNPKTDLKEHSFYEMSNAKFTESEMDMIEPKLKDLAISDPKNVRRILKNRLASKKSKEKQKMNMKQMENKIETLRLDNSKLSTQVTTLHENRVTLKVEKEELMTRLRELEMQSQLRNAMTNHLKTEVQRLRMLSSEMSRYYGNNGEPEISNR
ncbi:unnamed protein product [Cochlearia groenlandica]